MTLTSYSGLANFWMVCVSGVLLKHRLCDTNLILLFGKLLDGVGFWTLLKRGLCDTNLILRFGKLLDGVCVSGVLLKRGLCDTNLILRFGKLLDGVCFWGTTKTRTL